ncbi:MAG TPA: DUF5700 domain-containing putative Zn-dependent protease [Gemmatimonadaceae bacterium]|nr:DUF5700 domain-containing putative Zn-dependent protease [Gemmatimonadaceae bacterium]
MSLLIGRFPSARRAACIFLPAAALGSASACRAPIRSRSPQPLTTTVQLVADESEASVAIIEHHAHAEPVEPSEWRALFNSAGYRALVARDSTFGSPRDDSAFARFLMRDSLAARVRDLSEQVRAMAHLDVTRAAQQALSYAPPNARIVATIFPVVKPQSNSFVFGPDTAPQLFLFVNVDETSAHFFNRLTHELHHVALNTACAADPAPTLAEPVHALVRNLGGFGEGLAMLAAAGSPNVDANAESDAATRARWDAGVRAYPRQFAQIEKMVRDVVEGRIATRDSVRALAQTFYGAQGPWYVVGWKMAATIEQVFGRQTLIAAMCDPRRLMAAYNRAAALASTSLPRWDPQLLAALRTPE